MIHKYTQGTVVLKNKNSVKGVVHKLLDEGRLMVHSFDFMGRKVTSIIHQDEVVELDLP